ncbi:unnamed protein product [Danaus chrysippus]|uniref:(African queen) hypothetical protein n=1 Tax=Danaus chrysippus TaxID=151541 RepID=A0A8J2Q1Y4_9NEOP|nr:unnamed protein product [Danaus chrysippus]
MDQLVTGANSATSSSVVFDYEAQSWLFWVKGWYPYANTLNSLLRTRGFHPAAILSIRGRRGPNGLLPAEIDTITEGQSAERTESPKYRHLAHARKATVENKKNTCTMMNSTLIENVICTDMIEMEAPAARHTNTDVEQPTMADIAKKGEWKTQNTKSSEWITVQNKR